MSRDRHYRAITTVLAGCAVVLTTLFARAPHDAMPRYIPVTFEVIYPTATATRTPVPTCPVKAGELCREATEVPTATVVPLWPGRGPANAGMLYRMPETPFPTIAPAVITATAEAEATESAYWDAQYGH